MSGSLSTGNLTSLFSYVMSVLMSLMMLSMIFVMITMSAASGRRIAEVLNEVPDMSEPEQPEQTVSDGSIDFNHVSFSYKHGSGEQTLEDIDLHIRAGETIGIIGGTGSGKSSLVSLVSRLYDVDSGSVCVGGKDVRSYDTETLRNQVAVVLQKTFCSPGRFWRIFAGARKTPPRTNAPRPAVRPAQMNLSSASPTGTIPGSSRAAAMFPAVRNSVCALPARF